MATKRVRKAKAPKTVQVEPAKIPTPEAATPELHATAVLTPKIVEHQASGHDVTTDERSLTGSQTTATRSVLVDDSGKPPVAPQVVPDALVTHTLAVLGRRGAVAEKEVREVLEASAVAAPLAVEPGAEGAKASADLRFAHERVIQPDGTPKYFTQGGEEIDPKHVVLSGHVAPAEPVVP